MRGDPPLSAFVPISKAMSTPHARGSTPAGPQPGGFLEVYPACAGIHRIFRCWKTWGICLPRMRGDPPSICNHSGMVFSSTPHARGSTPQSKRLLTLRSVYPACAGIHPLSKAHNQNDVSLPRMRGDPPTGDSALTENHMSTPHARGSTLLRAHASNSGEVYPACAGIHLFDVALVLAVVGLPRMRGDPPGSLELGLPCFMSTPHARGSTCERGEPAIVIYVYPACAGIHLTMSSTGTYDVGLPRMRGDPPVSLVLDGRRDKSTPHARGSTCLSGNTEGRTKVYPACAGIHSSWYSRFAVNNSLPRMRGDPPRTR